MAWDAKRKSHEGLLAAGYRGPWLNDAEHPENCPCCDVPLKWYMSPNTKLQPFTASSFEPHHGDCRPGEGKPTFADLRKRQKAAGAK